MLFHGFAPVDRSIMKWGWLQNGNTFRVFMLLLLGANYSDTQFEDITVHKGQCVTSMTRIAETLAINRDTVRRALKNLQKTKDITVKKFPKFLLITVNSFNRCRLSPRDYFTEAEDEAFYSSDDSTTDFYTSDDTTTDFYSPDDTTTADRHQSDSNPTDDRRMTDGEPTHINNNKEISKRVKKSERGALARHGTFGNVFLSSGELTKLRESYPNTYQRKIERLSRYMESRDKHFSNHYATLLCWLEEDEGTPSKQSGQSVNSGTGGELDRSYDISTLDRFETLDFI